MTHADLLTPPPPRRRRGTADATPPAPARLIDGRATARADGAMMGERIVAALEQAAAHKGLLAAEQRLPKEGCYARHPIYGDPAGRFTIIAIVWGPDQFSPIHAHHAWCAYAVCEGA